MILIPNSWGSGLREFNPNHEPAGSPIGGRFAKKSGASFVNPVAGAKRGQPGALSYEDIETAAVDGDRFTVGGITAVRVNGRWHPVGASGPGFDRAASFATYVRIIGGPPSTGYGQDTLFKTLGTSYVATTGQSGQAALDTERTLSGEDPVAPPDPSAPGGEIFKEPPKSKGKKPQGTPVDHRIEDAEDHQAVADALGLGDVERLANEMFSEITSEKFRIEVSSEGGSSGSSDAPEPSEVQSEYDEWQMEQLSEAEGEAYQDQKTRYKRNVDRYAAEIEATYTTLLAEYRDRITIDNTMAGQQVVYDYGLDALLGEEGEGDEAFDDEGRLRTGTYKDRLRKIFERAIEEGQALPETFDGIFNDDDILSRSKYFNDDDGWDNWLNDEMMGDADIPSFNSWYESRYGIDPDDWGNSGDVDADSASLKFSCYGDKGTYIERTFNFKDGQLHVHHDYFQVGEKQPSGEGLGKDLFRGSFKAYERVGLELVTVYANIDLGGYSWARYGFVSENPSSTASSMKSQLATYVANDVLTSAEAGRILAAIGRHDPRNVWEMSDMRLRVGRERAEAAYSYLRRSEDEPKDVTYNRLLREDAKRGFLNIGKIVMANMNSWSGVLELSDADQMARLRAYLGLD